MGLERYQEKRNFGVTPEPRGRTKARTHGSLSFVIQKHDASHLHYDFRLELDGVLLSWAVPKGPSLDPVDKRLAMHVEDHPIEYGKFEGIIPEKQYGGGTVMVWDRGRWLPKGDPLADFKKGRLKFDLAGEKLKGGWMLVRTHGSKYGSGKSEAWLLIKERDEYARTGLDARIVEGAPDSVASGRTIAEIAEGKTRTWHSNRSVAANVKAQKVAPKKSGKKNHGKVSGAVEGAVAAAMPAMLVPALATLLKSIPTGGDWVHEMKYDGYRMLCRLEDGKCRIFSRNGKDWTSRIGVIAKEVEKLDARRAWLDGEACVLDDKGRSSFNALQNAIEGNAAANIVFFAFDLPYLEGQDLRKVALEERKRLLRELLERSESKLLYSEHLKGSGGEIHAQACKLGLEGVVSKRANSIYSDGLRTRDWVKTKCLMRQEMVIAGYTEPQGGRQGFGALLLGVHEDNSLRYAGKVGTGFDEKTLAKMRKMFTRLEQSKPAFANPPRGYEARGAHWLKPTLVAEIEFTEWSSEGALRHGVFLGLRKDKKAADVIRERPGGEPAARDVVAGVKLSHPDKVLFPEAGLSKRDLALYYETVADRMLPHIAGRPLSLLRCPDGRHKECFYQKHANESVHASVTRVKVPEGEGKAMYFSADSLPALVSLVQWGALELHPWGSRVPDLAHPDRLIFDFDPADDVPWKKLVEGVQVLRTLVEQLGLQAFLKTTGGKGLHVVVPVETTLDWVRAKGFTKAVAELFARKLPERFTASISKEKRKGRIFIDYLRNAEGATAIAPYAFRARENAPVSVPIYWDSLSKDQRFDYFNVKNLAKRLAAMPGDPWKAFDKGRRKVTRAMQDAVGYAAPKTKDAVGTV